MKVLILFSAFFVIVALGQDDAPYPSWMREQDDDLARRQREVDSMPDSPLKQTRLYGLQRDRDEARSRAAVYESQRQENARRREAERARSLESARRAEADLPRQRVAQAALDRQQEAADSAAMRDANARYQNLNWQGPYTQQQRSFDDDLRRDREAAYNMAPSPLRDTRLFGIEQREQQQRQMYDDSVRRAEQDLRRAQQDCGSGRSLQAANGPSCDFRKVQQLQQRVKQAKEAAQNQRGRRRGAGAGAGARGDASQYRRPYNGNRRVFNYKNGRRMYAVINPRNGRIRDMQNIGRSSRQDQRRQHLTRSDRESSRGRGRRGSARGASASQYRRPYNGNRRVFNYKNGRRMYAVINPRNGRIRDMQNIGRSSRQDQRRQHLRRSDRPSRR